MLHSYSKDEISSAQKRDLKENLNLKTKILHITVPVYFFKMWKPVVYLMMFLKLTKHFPDRSSNSLKPDNKKIKQNKGI